MAKCSNCGKFILIGKKQGDLRFCNNDCHAKGYLAPMVEIMAPELVKQRLQEVHQQSCPICGGEGPVDLHTSYTALSVVALTYCKNHSQLSCADCGAKSILRRMAFTAAFGWWGIPFGLILTPVQLIRGLNSLTKHQNPSEPSAELQHLVKLEVAGMLAGGGVQA